MRFISPITMIVWINILLLLVGLFLLRYLWRRLWPFDCGPSYCLWLRKVLWLAKATRRVFRVCTRRLALRHASNGLNSIHIAPPFAIAVSFCSQNSAPMWRWVTGRGVGFKKRNLKIYFRIDSVKNASCLPATLPTSATRESLLPHTIDEKHQNKHHAGPNIAE